MIDKRRVLPVCAAVLFAVGSFLVTPATAETLTVGCDTSFKPFEFSQNGKYVGFDIDLWTDIAKDLGLTYELRSMDFNGLIPALQTRNIDLALSGMTIREARKKVIDFSDPYYASGLTALVKVGNTTINKPADLHGKTIGAKTGTATIDYLKKEYPDAAITSFPNIDNALLELQAGRVDAVVHDTPEMIYYAGTAGKGLVQQVSEPISSGDFYGIGFPKDSPLVAKVDDDLKKIKADGRYQQIYKKWFGTEAPTIP